MASTDRNEQFANLTASKSFTDPSGKTITGEIAEISDTGGGGGSAWFSDLRAGYVVAWNDQTYARFDDANTTDVLGDARDELNANGGYGVIDYASDIEQDEGGIGGFSNMTIRAADGPAGASSIEFTDLAADGFLIDGAVSDEHYTTLVNVRIDGSSRTNRTSGSAIKFDTAVPQWELKGNCDFRNWIDPVIHMNTGHPFESDWGTLYFQQYDGRGIYFADGGEPLKIRHMTVGPENETDPTSGQAAYGLMIEYPGGYIGVDSMDSRANKFCPRQVHAKVSPADAADFGVVDWESSVTGATAIVFIAGGGYVSVDKIRCVGTDTDAAYQLNFDNQNHVLGPVQKNSMTFGVSKVNVTDDTAGLLKYDGPASDITNNSGTSPLSSEIDCWGSNFSG